MFSEWSVLAVDRRSRTSEQKITSGRRSGRYRHSSNYIYLVVSEKMQPHFFTAWLRLWLELKCYQLRSIK